MEIYFQHLFSPAVLYYLTQRYYKETQKKTRSLIKTKQFIVLCILLIFNSDVAIHNRNINSGTKNSRFIFCCHNLQQSCSAVSRRELIKTV